MFGKSRTYLALGDSMSIDLYTGVAEGGAVSQFNKFLGDAWTLDDRTCDMCRMARGIYLILDESDGKSYVGAAFGTENLLGRWLNYAKSGHGGNKKLKGRDPAKFRFSVLQILPHDMDEKDVQFIEKTWKDRLHTREFGLNDN